MVDRQLSKLIARVTCTGRS